MTTLDQLLNGLAPSGPQRALTVLTQKRIVRPEPTPLPEQSAVVGPRRAMTDPEGDPVNPAHLHDPVASARHAVANLLIRALAHTGETPSPQHVEFLLPFVREEREYNEAVERRLAELRNDPLPERRPLAPPVPTVTRVRRIVPAPQTHLVRPPAQPAHQRTPKDMTNFDVGGDAANRL